jgi:hypothetical protein
MKEVYRKRGTVARWENGTIVCVSEAGVAVEEAGRFECWPEPANALDTVDPAGVIAVADAVRCLTVTGVSIERLVVSEGLAEHQAANAQWTERSQRVHLSLVRGTLRALVDLGSFEVDEIDEIVSALRDSSAVERPPPARLRLAPRVMAALLPSLAGLTPPNVRLRQTAGRVDGRGVAIEEAPVERPPWPNWYRPSYRSRPVRMPFDLRLESDVLLIEPDRPIAVAMLAPPAGLVARVLVRDGRSAFPATFRLTRIDAVAAHRTWYPYGAGSFGAEMML